MIVVHKNTDITEYVSSMSWGGSKSEVARKLELHIVNAPLDKNITPLTINLADPIYLFEDDGKTELCSREGGKQYYRYSYLYLL